MFERWQRRRRRPSSSFVSGNRKENQVHVFAPVFGVISSHHTFPIQTHSLQPLLLSLLAILSAPKVITAEQRAAANERSLLFLASQCLPVTNPPFSVTQLPIHSFGYHTPRIRLHSCLISGVSVNWTGCPLCRQRTDRRQAGGRSGRWSGWPSYRDTHLETEAVVVRTCDASLPPLKAPHD